MAVLAGKLRAHGIPFEESRIVRDVQASIIAALDELRKGYDIVFTSGGIGPTHDDITTAAVAKAFGVPVVRSERTEAIMRDHYKSTGRAATAARLSMADVPEGCELIECDSTPAPGFRMENVHVLAGVPPIFADMVDAVLAGITPAGAIVSHAVVAHAPESEIAELLAAVQEKHPTVDLGSYPKSKDGRYYCELVATAADPAAAAAAFAALVKALSGSGFPWNELA